MLRFVPVLAAGVVLALAAPRAVAQKAGTAQPDCLPFGSLHIGSVAEGSFLVYAPPDDPKPKVKAEAPKFVTVLNTTTRVQNRGKLGAFTCVTVEVAIDTAAAGEFNGHVLVTVGEQAVKVPVSATVKPRKATAPRVLVVGSPFSHDSTRDGKEFGGWTRAAATAGLDVSYLLVRDNGGVTRDINLSKFDGVLVGPDALCRQTAGDVARVRAFAERGGRVVVAADNFFVGSVKGANAILDGYGLEMKDVALPGRVGAIELAKDRLAAEVVKAGVGKAVLYRPSPVQVDKGQVLVSASEFDGASYGYAAVAPAGKGEVVALGVSLCFNWVSDGARSGQANGSDNGKLLCYLLAPVRKG